MNNTIKTILKTLYKPIEFFLSIPFYGKMLLLVFFNLYTIAQLYFESRTLNKSLALLSKKLDFETDHLAQKRSEEVEVLKKFKESITQSINNFTKKHKNRCSKFADFQKKALNQINHYRIIEKNLINSSVQDIVAFMPLSNQEQDILNQAFKHFTQRNESFTNLKVRKKNGCKS